MTQNRILQRCVNKHHLQNVPSPTITPINPTDATTPTRTIQIKREESAPRLSQLANNPVNHATPRKETGQLIYLIVPHGPFVIASQPLPSPQPGAVKNPNLEPVRIIVNAHAPRTRMSAMKDSGLCGRTNVFWFITCARGSQYQEHRARLR